MKKLLSLFLAVLMLPLSLVGCAVVPATSGTDSAESSSPASTDVQTSTASASSPDPESALPAVTDTASDSGSTATEPEPPEFGTPQQKLEATPHLVGLTDQKNSRLIVRDLAAEDWSEDSIVWEYEGVRGGAGIALRDSEVFGGKVVLFCGPDGAGILSYETKELLFFTPNAGINPHAVELLPDGTFIVGSTTDNLVSVFAAANGKKNPVQTLTYENVHGILWDPEYNVLWMAGRTNLSAFAVSGTAEKPYIALIQGMVFQTGDWLHDLTPCYGNPQVLLVTCGTGIYLFDKETEKFTATYPCSSSAAKITTSPAAGFFSDQVLVLMAVVSGKTVFRTWCMNEITVFVPMKGSSVRKITRVAPNDAYYKVRVWNADYQ